MQTSFPNEMRLEHLDYPLATRWPRFFARIFDVWWETLLVAFVVGVILGRYSASFVAWINGLGATSQLLGILCLPVALILDATLYRLVGSTPGKAFLGLKVQTLDGKPLTFAQYLRRNFSMWVRGLALGFPLVNLLTMAGQARRLDRGQQASYDESTGFRVRAQPLGRVRQLAFSIAFAGLLVVVVVLNGMALTTKTESIVTSARGNYSWKNPVTKIDAKINSRWKHSTQVNETGQQVYTFSERTNRAVVILAVEEAPGYTLDDYLRAYQKNTAADMRFSDSGSFFEKDGYRTWVGTGSMVKSAKHRLNVQVVQVGSAFWRVVTIQAMPYDYTDTLLEQLHFALWSTVS